jgi:hypothetical protein
MNVQLVIAMVLVAGAGLYLAQRAWRTWNGSKTGCSGGCGCASKDRHVDKDAVSVIPVEELRLRRPRPVQRSDPRSSNHPRSA